MDYCEETFLKDFKITTNIDVELDESTKPFLCLGDDCSHLAVSKTVCGISRDGIRDGFRVRLFQNEYQLSKHNFETNSEYNVTDFHLCTGMDLLLNVDHDPNRSVTNSPDIIKLKNLVVVDGSMLDRKGNINDSINKFFAATHVSDLPVKEMLNKTTRRMVLNVFGPMVVYEPWTKVPENKSDDRDHSPTLNSCYHKCPTQCPSTYAPVCGVPGTMAREPSLMFQNHCFMDVAQCKMQWENKSPTALSSYYVESGFVFCLGYELNNMYRFLPLVRTLQHMGRLRKKGHFRIPWDADVAMKISKADTKNKHRIETTSAAADFLKGSLNTVLPNKTETIFNRVTIGDGDHGDTKMAAPISITGPEMHLTVAMATTSRAHNTATRDFIL